MANTPTHISFFILITTFILSILTYKYIETPFRNKQFLTNKLHLFGLGISALGLLFITGLYIYIHNGLPERVPESARAIAEASVDFNPRRDECFKNNAKKILTGGTPCTMGIEKDTIDFVLWGDSHADALMPVFEKMAIDENAYGVFFAIGGCAPILTSPNISKDSACVKMKTEAINFINNKKIKTAYLSSEWKKSYSTTDNEQSVQLQDGLSNTIDLLGKGKSVTIIKSVPIQENYTVRDNFYTSEEHLDVNSLSITYEKHKEDVYIVNRQIDTVVSNKNNVYSVDPATLLCGKEICPIMRDGTIIYRDGSHVNTSGVLKFLSPLFIKSTVGL